MTTYALNGLGRIGKLALKPLLEKGAKIAWINDAVGDPEMHAHLFEFDTVHGRWQAEFAHDADSITVDGVRLPFVGTSDLSKLPMDGVDVVIDCTGVFKTEAKIAPYFQMGAKKVVVSAPVKDGPTANIVFGVNDDIYDAENHNIVTAASCTTNCLAPVVKVLHESIGISHGSITTIASLTDCVFEMDRATSVEEVNTLFKAASEGPLKDILGYEERPLVSTDYTNDTRSSIVDALFTMVVNGTQVKVYAWYDNEMGYAHRLVDVALMVGGRL